MIIGAVSLLGCGDAGSDPVTQEDYSFYIPMGGGQYYPADGTRCIGTGELRVFSDKRFREIRVYYTCGQPLVARGADTVTGRMVGADGKWVHVFDGSVARADTSTGGVYGALEIRFVRTHYLVNEPYPGIEIEYARNLSAGER